MSKNGYDVYLDKCLLPISPESLQMRSKSGNKTVSLISGEQVNILKKGELTEIDFTCLIPQGNYPFNKEFRGADYYLGYLEKLKSSGSPFQFIVCRSTPAGKRLFNTNLTVSLEDYSLEESAENGFDIIAKIFLKEYRPCGIKTVSPKGVPIQPRADSVIKEEKPITVGCDVIVNGRLHGTSYGDAPGQMRINYKGKINFINLKGSHPYHVTTPQGLWQGWVTKESVKGV